MPIDRNAGTILSIFIQTVEENQSSKGVKLGLDRTSRPVYKDRPRGKTFRAIRPWRVGK